MLGENPQAPSLYLMWASTRWGTPAPPNCILVQDFLRWIIIQKFRALCRVKDPVDGLWYQGVMVQLDYYRHYNDYKSDSSPDQIKMKCSAFNSLGEKLHAWSHNIRVDKARV
jgi:hypothetical protein